MKALKLLALFAIYSTLSFAQNAPGVFTFNEILSENGSGLKAKTASDTTFFALNAALFESGALEEGLTLGVARPEGISELTITRISEFIPGNISIRAESKDGDIFSFTYHDGLVNGLYHGDTHSKELFRYSSKAKAHYITATVEDELTCGSTMEPELVKEFGQFKSLKAPGGDNTLFGQDLTSNTTIDILATYTRTAKTWAFQNTESRKVETEIAQAFNLAQTVLDNSKIPVTLRVVHVYGNDYGDELTTSSEDILRQITASPGFNPFNGTTDGKMDEIHDLRAQYGADLVSLFASVNDVGGLAWLMGSRSGSPQYGFNLTRIQQASSGYTLIHEIGHNLGNAHSRSQPTNTAGILGGVFMESVGFHNSQDSIFTVMGYGFDTYVQVPHFSSNSVRWKNKSIGSNEAATLAEADMSIKKVKGIVASYNTTVFEPPIGNVQTNSISATLDPGNTFSATVAIQNSGASNLDFDLDFNLPDGVVLKARDEDAGISQMVNKTMYAAGFESGVISSRGFYGWRAYSSGNYEPKINLVRDFPKTGNGHLKVSGDGNGSAIYIYSPFLQGYIFGSYKVSFDILSSDIADNTSEQFETRILDGKTGDLNAAIAINQGVIFVLDRTENGSSSYVFSGVSVTPDTYYKIEVEYNSMMKEIIYYVNSQEVHRSDFAESGNVPQEMIFLHTNTVTDSYFYIDNLSIVQTANPYSWLTLESTAGTVSPGQTVNVPISLTSTGVPTGTYTALLKVTTNEQSGNTYEVPIQLTVTNATANAETGFEPTEFALEQNYPNPFNPSTIINYQLDENAEVRLQVFDMMGREVATLVSGYQAVGSYSVDFDASALASGMYIYRLTAGRKTLNRQMMLIK